MRWKRLTVSLIAIATVLATGAVTVLVTAASTQARPIRPYLALGDSVTFGFIVQAGFQYRNPDNFVGYPTYVGDAFRLDTVNASCPGETTSAFISPTGADLGCRSYKATDPLHVSYTGTQLQFATGFLRQHPNTKLVTIQVGANDVFMLQGSCASTANPQACFAAGLPAVLASISSNMDRILHALRSTHFHGVLMVVNYYSLDYTDPVGTAITEELNQAATAPARQDGAVVADAFGAFETAASTAFAGSKTCNAGLLNTSPISQSTCDVHPSQSGQQLLARTVEQADVANGGDSA
jgi:lysophospholipase L1-like esterase